jgi:predicted nucleic acid-binding protein
MKVAVVDASVVVQLYFEEDHSAETERLFQQAEDLLAPDLIWSEVANVIWKRHRRGDLSQEDASGIIDQALSLPLRIHASSDLVADALNLAMQLDRTAYDSLYLALAVKSKSAVVTADKRLVNSLAGSPLEKYVGWIGSVQ